MSIVNDNSTEDDEMFSASLTLDPDNKARLGNRVIVSHNVTNVTIKDDDGNNCAFVWTVFMLKLNG